MGKTQASFQQALKLNTLALRIDQKSHFKDTGINISGYDAGIHPGNITGALCLGGKKSN